MNAPGAPRAGADALVCARCRLPAAKSALAASGYSCPRCALHLAHLDVGPDGTVRDVIGWLRPPGAVLEDRYRIVDLLGRGGSAVTYLAEDLLLGGRRRAVKEVPGPRFDEAEARILSRVQHPALPDVTDRFGLEGMVYLVLAFDGSQTLEAARREAGGRVELERVRRWVAELCDVLAYLHEHDPPIVHRDLEPETILLDETGRIVVADLGMPGAGCDFRENVSSLAATIYALLSGEPAPTARRRAGGSEIRPPSAVAAGLPAALDHLLLAALGAGGPTRPASVREFRRAFEAVVGSPARA